MTLIGLRGNEFADVSFLEHPHNRVAASAASARAKRTDRVRRDIFTQATTASLNRSADELVPRFGSPVSCLKRIGPRTTGIGIQVVAGPILRCEAIGGKLLRAGFRGRSLFCRLFHASEPSRSDAAQTKEAPDGQCAGFGHGLGARFVKSNPKIVDNN